jgi:hypothetical protein
MNLREVIMKYDCLVVFIRYDSAEMWGFRYGLTLNIGTLNIMASTGVFVRVIFVLKRSISCDSQTPSMILTSLKHRKRHSDKKMGPERGFYEGRQRTKQTERQSRKEVDWIKFNT